MCHLLLLLPIVALPVFWIWPPSIAVPVYGLVAAVSAAVYIGAMRAMRRPVRIGRRHMLGAAGEVVARDGGRLTVRVEGELWTADAGAARPDVGEAVRVVAVDGLHLGVEPDPAGQRNPGTDADEPARHDDAQMT